MTKHILGVFALLALTSTALLSWPSEADAAAPFGPQTVFVLDYGDDLPQFNGDLETVEIETVNGSEYTHSFSSTPTIAPWQYDYSYSFDMHVEALGGTIYTFESVDDDRVESGSTLYPWTTGTIHDLMTPGNQKDITTDARCDYFEGTGDITLTWKPSFTLSGGYTVGGGANGYTTFNTTNVQMRVTYVPK